ncbi:type I restriction endonuclease subunit R [Enterococcus sp. 5B3_DIV0040]|uniref:type I restriction endonuclease subunit R n=1 Tax=Enterococcus sp. 5B3_DIV0040 TaxID=1834182 RepID=UPI000A3500C4|nr:type I restriction endonuclease subunit R [Enterococcus sp. 5B3_DIV0040]OTO05381.1 hypothetical protein A5883_002374 [Enterococcus sp. 5B3_DIV0040]OTO05388.1 hypothetical protein A5883_002381 [Enterococcus sp. 5B3_DIV0040]
MLPEEKARIKIDKQLTDAGWDIVARDEYIPFNASAVKEALMQGNKESDYLLFVDDKAIAVVEAKAEDNSLGDIVAQQAEWYSKNPQGWVGLWFPNQIPFVYLANGNKIYFKNMLEADSEYIELSEMRSPKKMLKMLGKKSEYGALPRIEKKGLRDCQYDAEVKLEASLKAGRKKALAILATGSGKTYLACLASYRLLNYTLTKRVLFLVDRNNLARQTETEFSLFDRTEKQKPMNELYQINRLIKPENIQGDIIISTIQKLFAVLTGQTITEDDEDKEDEKLGLKDVTKNEPDIVLGEDLKLPPDYFQFIIVDECHRSIYGKWKAVLDYFKDAKVLGLTATPTPEAYAYFNKNIVEEYTYEDSVVDGVNVPARVYRIITDATVHGGTINQGETVTDVNRSGEIVDEYKAQQRIDYAPNQLDRSVINPNQIESVLKSYMESIYTDLYPEREENWNYIPKTLIFAKDNNHATKIVEIAKKVFAEKFTSEKVPDNFVQKITYSAGDSNALIRDLRTEKDFRIAVTVTLVATGTDVKPLEVVLFMNDVKSDVLYTQMKGRGCRTLNEDKLREVTPNADNKNCFYIVDAVGVTESDKHIPQPGKGGKGGNPKPLRLDQLLERLSHGEVSDENLALLRDYCATIQKRYEDHPLFERHLNMFISDYGFSPRGLANNINQALSQNLLSPFENISDENSARKNLIFCLMSNLSARKKLLEMLRGYYAVTPEKEDEVIYKGFSKETAKSFIANFEQYLNDNADKIEALRIIYNSEDTVITYSMLTELQDKLIAENGQFTPYYIWKNYKILDNDGNVEELDTKQNIRALTHLIQLVRYAYKKSNKLVSLIKGYSQRFNLYCGQAQRELTDDQKEIMKQIADYIIEEGAISIKELNAFDTDLWRKGIKNFGAPVLSEEIITLAKFILKAA